MDRLNCVTSVAQLKGEFQALVRESHCSATVAVAQPRSVSFGMFRKAQWPGSRPQLDVRPLSGPCESGLTLQWLLSHRLSCDFIPTYACNKDCDVDLYY